MHSTSVKLVIEGADLNRPDTAEFGLGALRIIRIRKNSTYFDRIPRSLTKFEATITGKLMNLGENRSLHFVI